MLVPLLPGIAVLSLHSRSKKGLMHRRLSGYVDREGGYPVPKDCLFFIALSPAGFSPLRGDVRRLVSEGLQHLHGNPIGVTQGVHKANYDACLG